MVDMNSDHIFEVPDTPDQIQQSICTVSSSAARRGITRADGNPSPSLKLKFKIKNHSIQGQSSRGNASSEPPAPLDTDNIFRRARMLPVTEDLEAKLSPPKLDRTTETSAVSENGSDNLGLDQSCSISNHISCRGPGGRGNSCQIREGQVSQRDASRQYLEFLGVGSDLPTIPVGKVRNRARTNTSNGLKEVAGADVCSGSSPREDKKEVINIKATAGLSSRTPCDVPQRHVGQRKLVRNGCISPSNIVKRSVKADENQEMYSRSGVLHCPNPQTDVFRKGSVIDLTHSSPTVTRKRNTVTDGLISLNNMEIRACQNFGPARAGETVFPQAANQANSSNCYKGSHNKGKEIIHDVMHTEQTGEDNVLGVCPRAVVDSSFPANTDSTGISSEQGWRTTHNHTSKLPMPLLGKTTSSNGIESGSSGLCNQRHETAAGDNNSAVSAATTTRSASLRNRAIRISKGKRKHTSSSYHPGESSSSLNERGGSCLASSDTTAGRNHTTLRHDIPVIDIDDICSPELRSSLSGHSNGNSIDLNLSAQLESDELLARQLQEQLYNETPHVVPRDEIDAIIAMSLQHEEDEQRTSRTVRRFQNTRGARASSSSASLRARVRYETANSMDSYMQNAAPVTLGLRAIIAGYAAPHIQPNIDLNDYDALLALDENNHQHTGASESQINNLPQSVFQSTSVDEPCAVCLENPSIGDTIRTLPCFHKFHKECIDEWLRRKKLCPVCKCGITRVVQNGGCAACSECLLCQC